MRSEMETVSRGVSTCSKPFLRFVNNFVKTKENFPVTLPTSFPHKLTPVYLVNCFRGFILSHPLRVLGVLVARRGFTGVQNTSSPDRCVRVLGSLLVLLRLGVGVPLVFAKESKLGVSAIHHEP